MDRNKCCERGTWRADARTVRLAYVVVHMGQDSRLVLELRSKLVLVLGSKLVLEFRSKLELEFRSKLGLGFRSKLVLELCSMLAERNVNGAF